MEYYYILLHKKYFSPLLLNRKWRLTSFSFAPLTIQERSAYGMASIHSCIIPFFCDYVTWLESQPKILPLDRLSPITLKQVGHKARMYLSPNYSLKASWTGHRPINCLMQLWGKNWDWDMCLIYDDQGCCKAGYCESNHLTSDYISLQDLLKFGARNRKYIS